MIIQETTIMTTAPCIYWYMLYITHTDINTSELALLTHSFTLVRKPDCYCQFVLVKNILHVQLNDCPFTIHNTIELVLSSLP